jgi:REP element-mobilizing transposase RayT
MPRQARKKSSSGIYHIMLRGINRHQVFEDNEDREISRLTGISKKIVERNI